MPKVSVVIPNFNHARYLRRRVDSILTQTYQDFEVILLDDSSTDHSREIIASYIDNPKVRIQYNSTNSGSVFKQWNKGVQMARGRYIWIAESDDWADPGFLARMAPILDEQPEVTFTSCRSWRIGENDEPLGFGDWYFNQLDANHWTTDFVADGFEECQRFFVLSNPVPNASAVLFRKEVYERVGGADERLRVCGDYKVWTAMALEGKIAYIAEPLNYFRTHSENVRTRAQAGALDVAEYFCIMLSVLDRVAPPETLTQRASMNELFTRLPSNLSLTERIQASKQSLAYITDWNLCHNPHVPFETMRKYFADWEFALVGREFAISPPSHWRFFVHRCRFYRRYYRAMGWKLRLVNLIRTFGAPVVGYRHRHWPEQAYARALRTLGALRKARGPESKVDGVPH